MVEHTPDIKDTEQLHDGAVSEREQQAVQPRESTLFDPHPYVSREASVQLDPMDATQEFHDPIHGFVNYTKREIQIIDHPAFQRLFKVYQLGQTHLVFRGATHSRGQHSLGVVAAVELLVKATEETARRQEFAQEQDSIIESRWKSDRSLESTERSFVRLAALLHDIGHVVNGHTIEDELGLLHDHGSRQRLEIVLDRTDWLQHATVYVSRDPNPSTDAAPQHRGDGNLINVESLRERIDQLYGRLAESANLWRLARRSSDQTSNDDLYGDEARQLSASEILVEIIVKDSDRSEVDRDLSGVDGHIFRVSVLRDLVGNTVCADLIDYLQRDWRHIGRPRHLDTRLLQYMEILTDGSESKLVVNLRSNHDGRSRPDVMSAILELLENRYHLWEVALLHRTKTCASAMLERAIMEKAGQAGLIELVRDRLNALEGENPHPAVVNGHIFGDIESALLESILEVSDSDACRALSNSRWSDKVPSGPSGSTTDLQYSEGTFRELFGMLDARVLHKEIFRVEFGPYSKAVSEFLSPFKAPRVDRFMAACRRLSALRHLEADFELEPGWLVMYCLPFGLGKKLAEVAITYDDQVSPLTALDDELNVSGGHLEAQLNRYDGLWRVSLFASNPARDKLESAGLLGSMRAAFKRAVLGLSDVDLTMYDLAKIASVDRSRLVYSRNAGLYQNFNVVAQGIDSPYHYPTGQPTIRSHFLAASN